MSSVRLEIGEDTFEYPITGSINYGEEATNWAVAVTDALKDVKGPGDISTKEVLINVFDSGPNSDKLVNGLLFNTAFIRRILIQGLFVRKYTLSSSLPNKVEAFVIEGSYNGTEINFTQEGSGQDCEAEFYAVGGQFHVIFKNENDLEEFRIKFNAKVQVDESLLP